jgi:uncharacterized Zn finger protein
VGERARVASAEEYRKQAEDYYRRARESVDGDEALIFTLRGIELESMADELERGRVEQHHTQPPPAPTQRDQPAQQQQQVQQSKKDDE